MKYPQSKTIDISEQDLHSFKNNQYGYRVFYASKDWQGISKVWISHPRLNQDYGPFETGLQARSWLNLALKEARNAH